MSKESYALVDGDGRIVEWCDTPTEGYNATFGNGDWLNETCANGLRDFRIVDGEAVYDPTPESEVEQLKANLSAYDYIGVKIATGAATREDYAEQLAEAEGWRGRIRQLEEQMAASGTGED